MAPTNNFDPRIDAYIAKSKTFAQPILIHLRELVHKACPNVVESIKWSRPFFEYKGAILGNMSAFKEHCSFGRITAVKDLPSNKQMLDWLRQSVAFVDSGNYTSPIAARNKVVKAPTLTLETPAEFTKALKANK